MSFVGGVSVLRIWMIGGCPYGLGPLRTRMQLKHTPTVTEWITESCLRIGMGVNLQEDLLLIGLLEDMPLNVAQPDAFTTLFGARVPPEKVANCDCKRAVLFLQSIMVGFPQVFGTMMPKGLWQCQ